MSTLLPFSFARLPVRGRLIRLTGADEHVPTLAHAPQTVARALTELLAFAALLMHEGERQAGVSLQIQHRASGALMFARVKPDGSMKAYANQACQTRAGTDALAWADGEGLFAVTLEPANGAESTQSLIPLDDPSPAACLRRYFNESVQTPTRLVAAQRGGQAAVLLLQGLPGLDENGDDWHRLGLMLHTATEDELLSSTLTGHSLIHRLFAEDDLLAESEETLTFSAANPREAMLRALASLPAAELAELLEAGNGSVEMRDETGGTIEKFTAAELHHLLTEGNS